MTTFLALGVVSFFFVCGMIVGFWIGILYITGKEHAQTEKWNNDKNIYFGGKLKFNDKDYTSIPIKNRY